MGGNRKLLTGVLRRFTAEHGRGLPDLQSLPADAQVRYAHTVRGVAGLLGATPLQEAAAGLERALTRNGSLSSCDKELRCREQLLRETVAAMQAHLGAAQGADRSSAAISAPPQQQPEQYAPPRGGAARHRGTPPHGNVEARRTQDGPGAAVR
ncbi:MAG: Hpt domain-containing protein, partial [Deltaproteobacteria bacterium]|nr:Hpt domain-containing protein [Deltaproteobacteria bacterium]